MIVRRRSIRINLPPPAFSFAGSEGRVLHFSVLLGHKGGNSLRFTRSYLGFTMHIGFTRKAVFGHEKLDNT